MIIEVSPEDEAIIRRRLNSGAFSSAQDVVHEALVRMDIDEEPPSFFDNLDSAIAEALAQAERGEAMTPEQSRHNQTLRKAEWLSKQKR